MSVLSSTGRTLAWGGLAATVLLLNQVGVLDQLIGSTNAAQSSVVVEEMDLRMQQAEAEALATLDDFITKAASSPPEWEKMALRVEFTEGAESETIWVEDFAALQGDLFEGRLTTASLLTPDLEEGRTVTFRQTQISDWSFEKGGRGYGYFTVHAELPLMADGRAQIMRGFLADHPIPKGW